jgi:dienelactone hydrolase
MDVLELPVRSVSIFYLTNHRSDSVRKHVNNINIIPGMCLGGHLAYRCALDPRISSAICYFATDIHSSTLGAGKNDDSIKRAKDIKGELVMIFGKMDNHVPPEGRDLIRKTLHEAGVTFSFYEPAWAQRKYHGAVFEGRRSCADRCCRCVH